MAPVAALLLAGLAMRALGAWCYEFTQKADHGIVCLMVKHMLEGQGFPVFYYGQAYLGSLEPAVSAALCGIFRLSPFWINMGTAVVAWAFLPLVYLWGRGAAGRAGGLAALAFCVIGPPTYFQYEGWTYGGYAAIPLLTCAVLVVSLRMLVREMRGERNSHAHFLLLGVIAGLGWWQSPLLIPAFITSALLFLGVMRLRLFTLRLVSGAAGFFLGSLPLWIWNVRHHWQTFDMLSTEHRPAFLDGLRIFYRARLPELLGLTSLPAGIRPVFALLLILLTILAVVRPIRQFRARSSEKALHLAAAVGYALLMSVLFTLSHYAKTHALRYILVMIPVLGVLVGAGTAWLIERMRGWLGWLPLLALVALQAAAMPTHFRERAAALAFVAQARECAAFLRTQGIRHVYADYQRYRASHGLNFLLDEEFVFSPPRAEKYRPYKEAMELAAQPAVMNDVMRFNDFLESTRGRAASTNFSGSHEPYDRLSLRYAIRPPSVPAFPVAGSEWEGIATAGVSDSAGALADGDYATRWRTPPGAGGKNDLEIRLTHPRRLAGVRLVCPKSDWPEALRVEGWDERQTNWIVLRSDSPCTRYFWSGPRFFWGGDMFRLECRFRPMKTARFKVRVTNPAHHNRCEIAELQVLEEAKPALPPGKAELDQLAALIRELGIGRVYADRWEANRLFERFGGRVLLSLEPGVVAEETLPMAMTLDGKTALVVREHEVKTTRGALAGRFIPARETAVGPWVVFDFPDATARLPHVREPGLRWVGFGCLAERDGAWAAAAGQTAAAACARQDYASALPLVLRAMERAPDDPSLARIAADCYTGIGNPEAAAECRKQAEQAGFPELAVPARFEHGMELRGITCERRATAGGILPLKLYWRCPRGGRPPGLAVFVHFKVDGQTVFQDDHALLAEEVPDAAGTWASTQVERRMVAVPAEVPPGEARIELGLVFAGHGGKRLKVKSPFARGKKAVAIPQTLTIEPAP